MRALTVALPLPLLLLWAFGCSSPKDNALFADGDLTSGAATNGGSSTGASAGTDSGSGASAGSGSSPDAGSSTGAISGGSSSGGSSSGGSSSGGSSSGGSSGSAGSGGDGQAMVIASCDMLDAAVTNEQNGHCYRINAELLSFAAARDACQAAAGHLVTVSDEAEDGFVHDQLDAVHWIGASDGRPDRMEGTGPYTWVDGEPWAYSNWESGQPNAVSTNCPDENSGSHCYEHCAFQTAEGAWNDRACWHTIASICEWEPVAK